MISTAFIKLGPKKSGGPLGVSKSGEELVTFTSNGKGIRLPAIEAQIVGGKDDGKITDTIELNQTAIIKPAAMINPRKYETIMAINPNLCYLGDVSYSSVIAPGEGDNVFIRIKASRKIHLKDFDYLFTFYMVA